MATFKFINRFGMCHPIQSDPYIWDAHPRLYNDIKPFVLGIRLLIFTFYSCFDYDINTYYI